MQSDKAQAEHEDVIETITPNKPSSFINVLRGESLQRPPKQSQHAKNNLKALRSNLERLIREKRDTTEISNLILGALNDMEQEIKFATKMKDLADRAVQYQREKLRAAEEEAAKKVQLRHKS